MRAPLVLDGNCSSRARQVVEASVKGLHHGDEVDRRAKEVYAAMITFKG